MLRAFLLRLSKFLRRLFLGEADLRQHVRGEGNVIRAEKASLSNVELDIIGDRNRILIAEGCVLYNLKMRLRGSGHLVELGRNCRVTRGGVFWIEDDGCELHIGRDTTLVEVSIAVTEPGSRVDIGEGCMLANDIDIRTGDSHSILDAASGKRINFAQDVSIGNSVWIAAHAIILKGVTIGENSVVAAGAIVTKSCDPGSLLAGNPARVVKTGISWKRERMARE
jgi:acetyltransferase-like isoleucine patch superfamily enzyme